MEAPSFNLAQYAQQVSREVDAALEIATQYGEGCPPRLAAAIRHSLLAPAKRLRPLLVLMAAEACGCDRRRAMPAAVAVEMVHTYSLIHDDLPAMDDDDLRRGRPTCHTAFDEATAILAGDALLAQAFGTLAEGIEPPAVAARCCAELARAAGATALVGGQADDLDAEQTGGDLSRLEAIHRRKTGALLSVSLRLGALVAGADKAALSALAAYGEGLGMAFQIVDDLLDVEGDAAALGKRAGKDSDRGKLTFPTILGIEESRRRAGQLIDQSAAALAPLGPRAAGLAALARFVLERNR